MTITHIDNSSIAVGPSDHADELLTFAGADTYPKGTILARLTATGKLVAFVKGGTGGAEIPLAVLTYEVVAAGAGDMGIRALVAGKVNRNRLIIDADGDGSNVDAAVLDGLRSHSIVAIDTQQHGIVDNPQP